MTERCPLEQAEYFQNPPISEESLSRKENQKNTINGVDPDGKPAIMREQAAD